MLSCLNDVQLLRQPGCWLGSSHSFKECVTAHWSSDRAQIIIGHQAYYRSYGPDFMSGGRRAFLFQQSCIARYGGETGKENVGISNDNADEKSAHRKTKVS